MAVHTASLKLAAATFMLAGVAAAVLAATPEPPDYWSGPMQGETPATLAGGKVVATEELVALIDAGGLILIDVAEPQRRPANLAPDSIWKPEAHRNIAGSAWIPGAGAPKPEPALDDFFRRRLAQLAGDDYERPLAFYCHRRCWASWNAAKRAISYGYRNVAWYPEGVEGWQDSGRSLAASAPPAPLL